MKESHRKGVAIHPGPESCVVSRKAAIEALTGESAGRVLSCEIIATGVPTPFSMAEGNTGGCVIASVRRTLRSLRPLACMETPRAGTGRPHRYPSCRMRRVGWRRPEPGVQQARRWGVGRLRTTIEVLEQRWATAGGGHGGKATDQREHWAGDRAPDSEPDQRVERLARCA